MRNPRITVSYGRYIIGDQRFAKMLQSIVDADVRPQLYVTTVTPAQRANRYQRTLIEAAAAAERGDICTCCS